MNTPLKPRLHPMLWVAALSVTAVSLAAIGTLTGWLNAETTTAPAAALPVAAEAAAKPAPEVPVATSAAAHKAPPAAPKPRVRAQSTPDAAHPPLAASKAPTTDLPPPPRDYPAPPRCRDCGAVEAVRAISRDGEGSGIGAVAGGVVGGALGSNVGQGNGRTLATLAGAIGGALLGNKIEKDQKKTTLYETSIRMEDGTRSVVTSEARPAWRMGDAVRVDNGSVVPR